MVFDSIGHSIIRSAQPRSVVTSIHYLAPMLSQTMYLVLGGLLVNEKSQLGFSISLYDEVNRYKQSVVQSEALAYRVLSWTVVHLAVADNVDHNVVTL